MEDTTLNDADRLSIKGEQKSLFRLGKRVDYLWTQEKNQNPNLSLAVYETPTTPLPLPIVVDTGGGQYIPWD